MEQKRLGQEDEYPSFKIGVRRKIPYLTNFFLILLWIFFLVIILFELIFYPFRNLPDEIQAFLFYFLVPEFWKKVLIFSIFGLFSTMIMYMYLRFYKPAILKFRIGDLYIRGRTIKLKIPFKSVKRIFCNDAQGYNGFPKEELTVQIEQRKNKPITLKLKDYSQAEDFINEFVKLTEADVKFYNFSRMPTDFEEE